jgi:hypothetical protein
MKFTALFSFRCLLQGLAAPMMLALIVPAATARAAKPVYRVSDNGRYLVDAKSEPVFWQGDTEWELLYALTAQDARELLQAMPWVNDNPLAPNEAFFTRMDGIVAAAQEEHVLLLIGVYHLDDVKAKRITLANVGGWTRWLAHRYKDAPNIIWTMYSALDPSSFPMVRASVNGLKEGDAGSHLLTLHPEGVAGSSSVVPADLSLNTFQSLSSGQVNYQFDAGRLCAHAREARGQRRGRLRGRRRYHGIRGTPQCLVVVPGRCCFFLRSHQQLEVARLLARVGKRPRCEASPGDWVISAIPPMVETDPGSKRPDRWRRWCRGALGRWRLGCGISSDERARDAEIECPDLVEDSLGLVDKSA